MNTPTSIEKYYCNHLYNAICDGDEQAFFEILGNPKDSPELKEAILSYNINDSSRNSLLALALQEMKPSLAIIQSLAELGTPKVDRASRGIWAAWSHALKKSMEDKDADTASTLDHYAHIAKILITNDIGTVDLEKMSWTISHIIINGMGDYSEEKVCELLEFMQDQHVSIHQLDEIQESPLAVALWNAHTNVARYLLEQGADPLICTMGGRTTGSFIFRSLSNSDKTEKWEQMGQAIILLDHYGYPKETFESDFEKGTTEYHDPIELDRVSSAIGLARAHFAQQELQGTTPSVSSLRSSMRL